ncbi:MAG: RagB/SusD family nutrient uptake outer membrane protein [Balneolales bacterium]
MNKSIFLVLIALIGFTTSCGDSPLDAVPHDTFDAEFIFSVTKKTRDYVHNAYNVLPYPATDNNGYNRIGSGTAMIASVTDEATPNIPGLSVQVLYDGSLSPSSSNPDNTWNHNYEYIRNVNIGLENIDLMPEADNNLKEQWRAELKFLRAFAHFELLKRFGGIPILTESLALGDDMDIPRDTFEETVNFIVEELDEAIPYLLPPQETADTNFGRISTGAAGALKARVLLYAASDLFNGSGYNGDGNELVSYGTSSADRWEAAAEAAADVIKLGYYSLYEKSEITDAHDDDQVKTMGEANYRELFYSLNGNRELILSRTSPQGNMVEKKNAPVGYTNGEGTTNPSQQMVDAYGMLNGKSIDDPTSGYDASDPYTNRDPRFEASILYNGKTWLGRDVETFEGGLDEVASNSTRTGYYLSKFMNPSVNISGSEGSTNHSFTLFRYAEVLLNYAEAVNEAFGPDADPYGTGLTAKQAIEEVRSRVLRPSDAQVAATDKNAMRDVIRAERRVELAFEDHRQIDARRWMIADEAFGENIKGIQITQNGSDLEYNVLPNATTRSFPTRMYLYPIPINEMSRNNAMDQNPLW